MNGKSQQIISFAEFEFDAAHRSLRRDGKPLTLYAKTFDLLTFLLENNGRIVSKDEILDAVWAGQFVEEANLSVQISALRKALGEKRDAPRFLLTVPGKGYKFIADIQNDVEEIVVEKHKISRFLIEREETEDEKLSTLQNLAASKLAVVGGFALLLAVAFGAYQYFNLKKAGIPFEKIKLTRLTNSGKVSGAAISPDGKYITYILGESAGNSL